jgi:selenophosphate synthase
MIADAQTSGGLLVALPQSQAEDYAKKCTEESGLKAIQIGVFSQKQSVEIIVA